MLHTNMRYILSEFMLHTEMYYVRTYVTQEDMMLHTKMCNVRIHVILENITSRVRTYVTYDYL